MNRPGVTERLTEAVLARYRRLGWLAAPEVGLPNKRRADVLAVWGGIPFGRVEIVEVKSSWEDFRTDGKRFDYFPFSNRLWIATVPEVAEKIAPHLRYGEGLLVFAPGGRLLVQKQAYLRRVPLSRRVWLLSRVRRRLRLLA